jgi:hypothetical protein
MSADSDFDMVKIGASRNPKRRVNTINTSCPYEVMLVFEKELSGKNAVILESEIHKYLNKTRFHMTGEWYSISVKTAISIINKSLDLLQLT